MEGTAQAEGSRKRARGEDNTDKPRQDQVVMKGTAQAEGSRKRACNDSGTDEPRRDFVYSPLDHQAPSIRLIRILEDLSPDGYIQCEILHASTDSNYVCLSYVWGDQDDGQWILLDGRRIWVRDNLGQFLQCARRNLQVQREWLWIDALSINQDNNSERSHQVQQMGQIYSYASMVISWLGRDEGIQHYIACIDAYRLYSLRESESFHTSAYWQRAWITQEFALARRNIFMAGNALVDSERVPIFDTSPDSPRGSPGCNDDSFRAAANLKHDVLKFKDQYLFHLLEKLCDKQCSNPRDRIFSLLALCSDCVNLKVDYDIPALDMALNILKGCENPLCFCSSNSLNHILKIAHVAPTDYFLNGEQPPASFAEESDYGVTDNITAFAPHHLGWKEFWIPISLKQFCDYASGHITFHVASASSTFFDSAVDEITYRWLPPHASSQSARRPVHGCTIQVSSGRTGCSILLSLAMFLELASISGSEGRHQCCSRVGITQRRKEYEPTLSLHEDQVKLKIHMDFNGAGFQRGGAGKTAGGRRIVE